MKIYEFLFMNPIERNFRRKSVLSLTISGKSFSIAQVKLRGRDFEVRKLHEQPLSGKGRPPFIEEILPAVTMIVSDRGILDREIVITIPPEWTLHREIDLPAAAAENLPDVISYEMDHFTPFTSEQVLFDFHNLSENKPSGENGKCHLNIYVVSRSLISPLIEGLKREGFSVPAITTTDGAIAALLHGLTGELDISFIMEGRVNRTIKGMPLMSEDPPPGLSAGIDSTEVLVFRNGNKGEPSPLTDVMRDVSRQKIKKEDVHAGAGAIPFLLDLRMLNFLSPGERSAPRPPLGLTIILAVVVIGLLFMFLPLPLLKGEKINRALQGQIDSLKPAVMKVESMKKELQNIRQELRIIAEFKTKNPQMLLMLRELTEIIPENTWITRLEIKGEKVTIEGFSDSATPLISLLESSDILKNVSFSSTTVKDRRMNKERFRIKGELERKDRASAGE